MEETNSAVAVPVATVIPEHVEKAASEALGTLIEKVRTHEEYFKKAAEKASAEERPKSWFADPFALLDSLGMGYRASPSYLTYDTLRGVSERDTVVAAIIATRVNQVAAFARPQKNKYSVGFKIQPRGGDKKRRLTSSEQDRAREIEHFLLNTGSDFNPGRDSFEQFLRKSVRDRLTYDQWCIEKVRSYGRNLHSIFVVPGDTIRVAHPKVQKGTPPDVADLKRDIKYVQLLNAQIVTEFTMDELAFSVANPRTHVKVYNYGLPEIETLMTTVTSHMWAEEWNRRAFSQGSTVKGVLNLKGNMPLNQFEMFKRQWHAQVAGVTNAWKTPVVNTDGLDWITMQMSNTEMGYSAWMEYLIKIACFSPEQTVAMADGSLQRIDKVQVGDSVTTHTGRTCLVKNVQIKKHKGDLVCLRAGGQVIRATREHPFFVVSSRVDGHMTRVFDDPDWVKAEDIVEGQDYLLVPKPRDLVDSVSRIDLADYVDCLVDDKTVCLDANRTTPLPRYIDLTEENAYVLGLYAAEGHSTEYRTTFCFAAHETDYGAAVQRFAAQYGLQVLDVTQKPSSLVLRFSSGLLARAFRRMFGPLATERWIPEEIMSASAVVQRAFLAGLVAGDGSVYRTARSVALSYCTASRKMAEQVQSLLLRQNVYAGLYSQERRSGFKHGSRIHDLRVQGTQLKDLVSWLRGEKKEKLHAALVECGDRLKQQVYSTPSYFLVPVGETWIESYDGLVYNMEVEDEHTYSVGRFAVHNCAIFQIDPTEINFDLRGGSGQQPLFMSSNEAQQKVSKDRGLAPLLRFIEDVLNKHVVWQIDPRFEFVFVGMDAKTEEQAIQLRMQQVQNIYTLNEVRAMEDLPPLKDGDVVLNPTYTGYKNQSAMMQQQQGMMGGAPGGPGGGPPGAPPGASAPPSPGGQMQPGSPPGGAPGEESAEPNAPYQGRFGSKPHGEEEQKGADNLRQFAEAATPQGSKEKEEDEGSEVSSSEMRVLHQNDWDSSIHSALPLGDLVKSSAMYATLDLE